MITAPPDASSYGKGELIKVTVDANDPNGNHLEVHFYLNDEGVFSTTVFPYTYVWDTQGYDAGSYKIKARAVDDEGETRTDYINVSIDVSTPRVETEDVISVHLTSATIGGSIISDGGATITETGVYWSEEEDPELTGTKWRVTAMEGAFSTAITGLYTNTPYYFRAYAVNSKGESLGEEKGFTTLGNEIGSFTDNRDGREYQWVRIGNQTWMAENLAYLTDVHSPDDESMIFERYYVYGYNGEQVSEAKSTDEFEAYGALYNYKASLNVCPAGWHLPTDEEWKSLEMNLGMLKAAADNADWRGSIEGRLLKSRTGWNNEGNGSNISDFNGVPGGSRLTDNTFRYKGIYANYWTSSEYSSNAAWYRSLYYNNTGVYRGSFGKEFGLSVRCVKD